MSQASSIEWTDVTWNPIRGCTRVSEGCRHCYAEGVAARFAGPGRPYEGLARFTPGGPQWTGKIRLVPELLDEPLHWRKPRQVFVNSMSDLFDDDVPDSFIMRVWLTMARTPWHTYQVVTKRPKRMQRWLARWADTSGDVDPVMARGPAEVRAAHTSGRALMFAEVLETMGEPPPGCAFPTYDWMEGPRWLPTVLPNVWLLVSVENQPTAEERIPPLLATPAAVRGVSAEPLLEPVDFSRWLWADLGDRGRARLNHLHWVIAGGESGRSARRCDPAWIRSLVEQCRAAGVPVFCKQLGAVWAHEHPSYPFNDPKGGEPDEWPEDLRVREWPEGHR